MADKKLSIGSGSFEQLKKINAYGSEYWSARDLQTLFGYQRWQNFLSAIKRAISACQQTGHDIKQHVLKIERIVSAENVELNYADYHLSRFACYLIAQNGDTRKPAIAQAQKYFAMQTRRQEVSDAIATDMERLFVRKQTSKLFKALSGAARTAGVPNDMFQTFHDAGYRGLYGGLNCEAIKALKDIPKQECLLDRMGTTELAANQFRMTQARDKLARERIHNPAYAILTHQLVAQEVRQAIARIGGTMPENLSPAEHIKQVEKRLKKVKKILKLEERTIL